MNNHQSRPKHASTLALLAVAAVGPALYPAWLAWKTRRVADPVPPEPDEWPSVSVVIPAYRERLVIAHKVENTLENGYPGPLDVIVVAEDEETAAAAAATPARVINGANRRGKAGALNVGVREATGSVVVLTDANAMLEPGGLSKLVRWLADLTVGAVTGEKRIITDNGEGLYWSFESWLKRRENRTGTTIGVGGELIAMRRADYVDLATDTAVDDFWLALDVAEQNKRIVYEPEARIYEEGTDSPRVEWERRTRIISGALDAMCRRPHHLLPGGPIAGQLWGHRLVRSSPGPIAHAVLLARAIRLAPRSDIARVFVGLHAYGAFAFVHQQRGGKSGRFGRLVAQILFLQATGIGGTLRWARGDRPAVWPKPERTLKRHDSTTETDDILLDPER